MRFAAIDLGTNTFHLIIAESGSAGFEIVYKTNEPVKLGENITLENKIIPQAFDRGVTCLKSFKATLDEFKVDELRAVATSGVRSATNGQHFIDAVKAETGITIEIIDGDTEAELIYDAVKLSGAIKGKSLIIDIGGGSTEFIFCDKNRYYWKQSFNIGAARLMQEFFKTDPISSADKENIENHLTETLAPVLAFASTFNVETLIGSAGAFETFAEMINPEIDLKHLSNTTIAINGYQKLSGKLITSNHQQRKNMEHLIPLRVDMIVMATLITNYILKTLNITHISVSTYDLKMGILQNLSE